MCEAVDTRLLGRCAEMLIIISAAGIKHVPVAVSGRIRARFRLDLAVTFTSGTASEHAF